MKKFLKNLGITLAIGMSFIIADDFNYHGHPVLNLIFLLIGNMIIMYILNRKPDQSNEKV